MSYSLNFGDENWEVFISKGESKSYMVTKRLEDNVYVCTCPDFLFRKKECKHIREIKEDGL